MFMLVQKNFSLFTISLRIDNSLTKIKLEKLTIN